MSGRRRPRAQRMRDRRRIADLYLRGTLQCDIAAELELSESTVSRDLATLYKQWRVSALVDIGKAKAQELAKLDHLEATYWQAWQKSVGDLRYLAGVQVCIDRRCKLLGLDAPEEHAIYAVDIVPKYVRINPVAAEPT